MKAVGDFMTRPVHTVGPETTLTDAARALRERDIGALPVSEHGRVVGIITDRDIALRVVAEGDWPDHTLVRAVMTPEVVHVAPDDGVDEAMSRMEEHGVHRLPVLDAEGALAGIVTLADLARNPEGEFGGRVLRLVARRTAE